MVKYYHELENDEKQQVANYFNKMYGEHLDKARCKIEKVAKRYDGKNCWEILWSDIRLKASKDLWYVIPFEDYVSIYKRVLRHKQSVNYWMNHDPQWGREMMVRCAQSPTDSTTIPIKVVGDLVYSGASLFNMRKATA